MKWLLRFGCVLLLGAAVVLGQAKKGPDEAARAAVIKLFDSLNEDQKKAAQRPFEDKDRYAEIFPETKRPGIAFSQLTAEQKTQVEDVIRAMTSEYGATACLEIAKQTGPGGRYITFFGTPKADGKFAWRIGQHHLTLIYAEYGQDKADEFGPILLGGNPVKAVWDEEEKIALELYAALSAEEKTAIKGKGNAGSGAALAKDSGVRIGDLSEKPRGLAYKLLEKRTAVFSTDRRTVLAKLVTRDGGVDDLRIAVWGEAAKSQHDGGNYHWKIGSPLLLVDWQTVGKEHIHMTVRGKAKG